MSNSSIRRRDFVAGAAATTGLAITSKSFAGNVNSLHNLKYTDFVSMVGHSFAAHGQSEQGTHQKGTLVLKSVVKQDNQDADRPSHVRSETFSLRFESRDLSLADGTHDVSGEGLGKQGVFLVEMLDQRDAGRRHYEAVFN